MLISVGDPPVVLFLELVLGVARRGITTCPELLYEVFAFSVSSPDA